MLELTFHEQRRHVSLTPQHQQAVEQVRDQIWKFYERLKAYRVAPTEPSRSSPLWQRSRWPASWLTSLSARPPDLPPLIASCISRTGTWVKEGDHGDGDYAEFLEQVDWIQRQQMQEIRRLEVRQVWVEGQSDETIGGFRKHVLNLRGFVLPQGDSPVDQLLRDTYQEDLLQMGAAGRLLLAGEIDDVLPLEDHDAWRAAKPIDGEIGKASNEYRERAMAKRLPSRAVIVLGAGHDLRPWLPPEWDYQVVRGGGAAGRLVVPVLKTVNGYGVKDATPIKLEDDLGAWVRQRFGVDLQRLNRRPGAAIPPEAIERVRAWAAPVASGTGMRTRERTDRSGRLTAGKARHPLLW